MYYQVFLNGNIALEGNVFSLLLITFIILVIVVTVAIILWRKIRENEVMKYEFITIIAHKFRTPLTHLKWILEELLSTVEDVPAKEGLADMQLSTDRLINLTGTLIELTNTDNESKIAYKFETVSLCELVRSVAGQVKKAFQEKNISFAVNCPDTDVMVSVDRARMEFVLQSLIENSYIYTPTGRRAEVSVGIEGRKAVVTVSDNGIGIDPADLPRIFGKFYRAKNAREADTEGFGVGLFMAQTVTERHGGKIEASSAGRDQGSTFRLILPLAKK